MSKSISDSGSRTTFETGAVRDIQKDKGRFDLIPYDVIQGLYTMEPGLIQYQAIWAIAKHFEMGALKYDERNWEKGIALHTYFNSAMRHLTKIKLNWNDEPHHAAVSWNLICMLHTMDKIKCGKLPKELWTLPGNIVEVNYNTGLDPDSCDDFIYGCVECLWAYMINQDVRLLVEATHFSLVALEREKNGTK